MIIISMERGRRLPGQDPWFHLYLSYEYFYWTRYIERFDTMIVSTQEQKKQ